MEASTKIDVPAEVIDHHITEAYNYLQYFTQEHISDLSCKLVQNDTSIDIQTRLKFELADQQRALLHCREGVIASQKDFYLTEQEIEALIHDELLHLARRVVSLMLPLIKQEDVWKSYKKTLKRLTDKRQIRTPAAEVDLVEMLAGIRIGDS